MYWRDIKFLYGEDEDPSNYPIYCRICKKKLTATHIANTELATDEKRGTCSHCNVALKLTCGHIVVDDCDSDDRNGLTFRSEADWRKQIVSSYDKGW